MLYRSKIAFFTKIIESNHIHLNQMYFARVRPLSAKCIFILSPAKLSIFDERHVCCQYFGAEFNPIYDLIYCQNLSHHCFNPLSFMELLFSAPFCPSLPPVLPLSPELINANLCGLAGAKTSRVGSCALITCSVCVCVSVKQGWPKQTPRLT